MQVVRVYTGSDGESHLEDLDLGYEAIAEAERTAMKTASGIQFRRDPPSGPIPGLPRSSPPPIRDYVGRAGGDRPG